jgi:hypothetical protein
MVQDHTYATTSIVTDIQIFVIDTINQLFVIAGTTDILKIKIIQDMENGKKMGMIIGIKIMVIEVMTIRIAVDMVTMEGKTIMVIEKIMDTRINNLKRE